MSTDTARSEISERPQRTTLVASFTADHFTDNQGWTLGSGETNLEALGIQVGDLVEQWGHGIGYIVRGCAIGGHVLWYRTEAEEQARHEQWVADKAADDRRRFEEHRTELDAQYDALPDVFKRRLDRFRAGNPDFRWQFEGYEMAACEAALIIAETDCGENDPRLDAMGLSGNQYGFARRLATWFKINPEAVVIEHGAMVPLVGCDAYGCTHPT